MKRTTKMWAVFSAYGRIKKPMVNTLGWTRKEAVFSMREYFDKEYDWNHYYKQGFRCRKVTISWEE